MVEYLSEEYARRQCTAAMPFRLLGETQILLVNVDNYVSTRFIHL